MASSNNSQRRVYTADRRSAEAERDRQAREELLKKLQEKLARGGKELIGHRSYRRHLDLAGTAIRLKQDVLDEEARYDGRYVLRTNAGLDTAETVQA